jgi:hypothetical protein
MKAKFGSIVVDGRGKLGGHVYSKNRGGAYVRTKVTPVNPQSTAQLAVRAFFTSLSQGWRSLTSAQREAWNGAVENFQRTDIFGDIKKPSGINLYMRLNQNILNAGGTAIDTPPAPGLTPEIVTFSSAPDSTPQTFSLVFAPSPIPADAAYVVECTPSLSPGKSFIKNQYRVVIVLPAADVTPTDILAAYQAKFGELTGGQIVGIRVKSVDLLTGVSGPVSEKIYTIL